MRTLSNMLWRLSLATVFLIVWQLAALAAEYPAKSIRIVVPYGPGSSADLRARQIAKPLSQRLGVNVVVENKPGASATIGNTVVAHAKPDGYTLLYTNNAGLCIVPHFVANLAYDPLNAFAPITQIATAAAVMVVPQTSAANTVKELVALAKSQPGKLSYGSSGIGSPQHLPGAWFAMLTGIDLLHVPYKSDAETMLDLTNGRIDLSIAALTAVLPHVKSGKLKVLAVTTHKRAPVYPAVPTIAEAGFAQFEWHNWFGFVAPANTPSAVLEKLQKEITAVTSDPALRAEYLEVGYEMVNSTPAQFAAVIKAEHARYGKLVGAVGLKPN